MRRCLLTVAVVLLLGALINVALALGAIGWGSVRTAPFVSFDSYSVHTSRRDSIGLTLLTWTVPGSFPAGAEGPLLPSWSRLHALAAAGDGRAIENAGVGITRFEYAAGWPMRVCTFEYDYRVTGLRSGAFAIRSGIEMPARMVAVSGRPVTHHRAIPTRIIPTRFAINTLVFALLAAVLWYSPTAAWRAFRRRMDRCAGCGYSRAGLAAGAVCPECGQKELLDQRLEAYRARQARGEAKEASWDEVKQRVRH